MRKTVFAVTLACVLAGCSTYSDPLYKDPSAPIDRRVEDLLKRMTFEEKVWQMTQFILGEDNNGNNVVGRVGDVPPIIGSMIKPGTDPAPGNAFQKRAVDSTRLGIPVLYGYDVIHGMRTIFPIPLAQGASFNAELGERSCRIAAQEAYACGVEWTFSPMIDIAHDPRWGRVMESYGEDPYVNSVFCVGAVHGYQGDDLSKPGNIAACLKHFVGYGAADAGRDYAPTDISDQMLWDTYLPPYEAGVKAGVATVMSAFNTFNGVPSSANRELLTGVLKERWDLKGFVVSDWDAISQTVLQGVAEDDAKAGEIAVNAGVDMDMTDFIYPVEMENLVKEGRVKMETIDEAVRRILRLKFELGLFENPYREPVSEGELLKPEYLAVAEEFAAESAVMLENDGVLPLSAGTRVAVIGPVADDRGLMLGNWCAAGRHRDVISILKGMKAEFGDVAYAKGCAIDGDDRSGFAEAVAAARKSDVVILCLGEGVHWTGENCSRGSISIPDIQLSLLDEIRKTGKKVVVLIESGRPMDLVPLQGRVNALIDIWCPGTCAGNAVAGLLSGRYNPSGKLPITFPYTLKQVPVYYNARERSRRGDNGEYKDGTPLTPLYEFGYGLSYSDFEYSEITLDGLTARVSVTNKSDVDGKEAVLWFVKDPFCSIARPVKELKHFEKRLIKAGETEEFVFEIDKLNDLGFVNSRGERFFEGGEFELMVGDRTLSFENNS